LALLEIQLLVFMQEAVEAELLADTKDLVMTLEQHLAEQVGLTVELAMTPIVSLLLQPLVYLAQGSETLRFMDL
jgi:hypothetical protein